MVIRQELSEATGSIQNTGAICQRSESLQWPYLGNLWSNISALHKDLCEGLWGDQEVGGLVLVLMGGENRWYVLWYVVMQ